MEAPPDRSPDRSPERAITDALVSLRGGSGDAMERLMDLVYADLRRMAHRQLGAEPVGHTLSTTALVHEAYLRLVDQTRAQWADRSQFFAVAARSMRRILVDHARHHQAARRGGPGRRPVALDAPELGSLAAGVRSDELVALDEVLDRLAAFDERLARLVECRYFAGLTESETADVLGVSQRTVARDWATARGWLYAELRGDRD